MSINIKQYLDEVKGEMKKVTWPSRKDAASGAFVVIIFVFIISFFLGLVDIGLSRLVRYLIQ